MSPTMGLVPFLLEQTYLLSLFLFSVPLATTLETDAEDPPCYCCLRAAAATLANALSLLASISAKEGNRR